MGAPIYKSDQLAYKYKRKDIPEGAKTEEPVQIATNEYLDMKKIDYIRIPDRLWFWLKRKCPMWLQVECSKHMAGWSDNVAVIPITNKYSLACLIECKSKTGKSKGKQLKMGERLNYQIPRTAQQTVDIINEFEIFANKLKKILENEKK